MEAVITVIAALVIASPLIVLALRTTRWDPVDPPAPQFDERDADARRERHDSAAIDARRPAVPVPPSDRVARTVRKQEPRLG